MIPQIRVITKSSQFCVLIREIDNVYVVKDEDTGKIFNVSLREIESVVLPEHARNLLILLGANDSLQADSETEKQTLDLLVKLNFAEHIEAVYIITQQGYHIYKGLKLRYSGRF